ncbi:MAG: hypothetical protein KA354_14885 [Phycisphaerae bacterium]|nr:hypothetical protein [Phycisphaerae bacterium]
MTAILRPSPLLTIASAASLLCALGCSDMDTSSTGSPTFGRPGDYATRRIDGLALRDVRPAALRAFRQHFRVDPNASAGDRLVSYPAEITQQAQPERLRDMFGGKNRHRQVAILVLSQEGTSVLAQCQVRNQRLDTAERAAFARETGDDRPGDTPIERRGASSPIAREEWTPVGRDRTTEAEILDSIVHAVTGSQPAGE